MPTFVARMHQLLFRIQTMARSLRALLSAACEQATDSFRNAVLPGKSGPGTLLGSLLHFYVALTGLLGGWTYPWNWNFITRLPQHERWRRRAREGLLLLGWLLFLASSLEWTPASATQHSSRIQGQELHILPRHHERQSLVLMLPRTETPLTFPPSERIRCGFPAAPCTPLRRYLRQRSLRI